MDPSALATRLASLLKTKIDEGQLTIYVQVLPSEVEVAVAKESLQELVLFDVQARAEVWKSKWVVQDAEEKLQTKRDEIEQADRNLPVQLSRSHTHHCHEEADALSLLSAILNLNVVISVPSLSNVSTHL